jgi:hypothetical protein
MWTVFFFFYYSKAFNTFSQDRLVNKMTVWLIGFSFIITKNIACFQTVHL